MRTLSLCFFSWFTGCTAGSDKYDTANEASALLDGTAAQEGQTYDSGDKISILQYGLSFTIPSGWSGQLEDGVFALANDSMGAAALVTAVRISKSDLKNAFRERQEIGDGVYMVQEGSTSESGNALSSRYDVIGEQDGSSWKGYIAAQVGDFDWTSISLGLSPTPQTESMVDAIDSIDASITLEAPYEGADFTGDWEKALGGHTFTYYYSASDYSDKTTYTLCQDGSASYFSSTYSGGITGPLTINNNGEGTWRLEYTGPDTAEVYFELTNDNSGTREFSVDNDGKFYVGGSRFYRETNGC